MRVQKEKTWQYEITGVDGNTTLFGVNIFNYDWKDTGERVKVKDPSYSQDYNFSIYEVLINEKKYMFAAGEFSNCVWGFYIKK